MCVALLYKVLNPSIFFSQFVFVMMYYILVFGKHKTLVVKLHDILRSKFTDVKVRCLLVQKIKDLMLYYLFRIRDGLINLNPSLMLQLKFYLLKSPLICLFISALHSFPYYSIILLSTSYHEIYLSFSREILNTHNFFNAGLFIFHLGLYLL